MTLHSSLHWNPQGINYDIGICSKRLNHSDLLIVDEVSMLKKDVFNLLAKCLSHLNKRPQIIMAGDFFQLPPVTMKGESRQYPFENPNWLALNLTPCVLQEVLRQDDPEFKAMLGLAMIANKSCIKYFNEKSQKTFIEDAIVLCTTNA